MNFFSIDGCFSKRSKYQADKKQISKLSNIKSAEDCQAVCQGSSACKAFNYNGKNCELINTDAFEEVNAGKKFVSGPPSCPEKAASAGVASGANGNLAGEANGIGATSVEVKGDYWVRLHKYILSFIRHSVSKRCPHNRS